jgi:hypothetical protein
MDFPWAKKSDTLPKEMAHWSNLISIPKVVADICKAIERRREKID